MKKLSLILTMVITGFYQTVAQGTIVDVAVGNKIFSTLVAAVKQLI
jgi:hypothetical protein